MLIRSILALGCLATPAVAERMHADADCTPATMPMHFTCEITLSNGETAVEGAIFTVTPTMPSMPMAHNIPPAAAQARTTPGTYSVDLRLDMLGEWMLSLDISHPRRDRVMVTKTFEEGSHDNHKSGHAMHSGHGKSD